MLITPLLAEGDLVAFDFASAIWILGIFLVLVIILYKTAWKHVLAGLKAREERIRGDIAAAEAAKAKADASLKEFNAQLASAEDKAKNILAQAALDAEKIIRRNLNPDDQRDLVKQSLEQLQSLNA